METEQLTCRLRALDKRFSGIPRDIGIGKFQGHQIRQNYKNTAKRGEGLFVPRRLLSFPKFFQITQLILAWMI
ncbi:MAG: hypothetical protein HYR56_12980 [Acidobacteria bacterium]|nr:hypothetical protein [Acidobacteriota bacterium]MBI3426960.1 hypothetical protein [Acidobacteriota bacterium]